MSCKKENKSIPCPDDVNTPTVDNTSLECTHLHNIKCIKTDAAIPDLNIPSGAGLDEVIVALLVRIQTLNNKILEIESQL